MSLSAHSDCSVPRGASDLAVHEMVAAIAGERPSDVAVCSGGEQISYGRLDAWARHIAADLAAAGAGRGDRVAILAEPSIAMVAATLGVMMSGAAYVPVDLSQPDQRISAILADAQVTAAVVTASASGRLADAAFPRILLGPPAAPRGLAPGALDPVTAADAAYLTYTSGSTGAPKGVVVEHGQLAASTRARHAVYPGRCVFLLVSPLAFDSSVAGLWGTLSTGGCLVVASADEVRDAESLVRLISRHRVTRTLCVPSLYGVILDAAARLGAEHLSSLETVIVAGEALPETLVERHFALLLVPLVNEYGPTEATVWASYHRFTRPGPVSIGQPIPGASLYVLDEHMNPVSPGAEGELYIGGGGVARCYFGRPEETARSFLGDPFAGRPDARMYRTGDLVRWNPVGTLDFLGRRDDQVKIRGHRLELGAVEATLRGVAGVRDAVVLPNADKTALVAFVITAAPEITAAPDITAASVREDAAVLLSPPMLPAEIRVLERYPLNSNGKVDRAALRRDIEAPRPASEMFSVGDQLTAKVTAAWAEVLNTSDFPADMNFFDLGGHSLSVFKLQDALDRRLGVRPPIIKLFQHTTVTAQVAMIRDRGHELAEPSPGNTQGVRRAHSARMRRQRVTSERTE